MFNCYQCASLWVRPFENFEYGRMDNLFLEIASVFLVIYKYFPKFY